MVRGGSFNIAMFEHYVKFIKFDKISGKNSLLLFRSVTSRKAIFHHLSHLRINIWSHAPLNQHIFQLTYIIVVLVTFDASFFYLSCAVIIFGKHKNQSYCFPFLHIIRKNAAFFSTTCNISICSAHLSSIVYSFSRENTLWKAYIKEK